jgi:di- and tripeptidase
LTEAEKRRYDAIAQALLPHHPEIPDSDAFTKSLMYRWREPSLTIHTVEVPGNKSSTTISHTAKASLSIRIVPNQKTNEVAAAFTTYAQEQFARLDSQNELTVEITGKSDPWLGDPENEMFKTLAEAISAVWTPDPDGKRHDYPRIDRSPLRWPGGPQLHRTDSSDSIASHVDRIISTTSFKTSARKPLGSSRPPPTSSTLARNSNPTSASTSRLFSQDSAFQTPHNPDPTHHSSTPSPSQAPVKPIYIREGGSIPMIRFLEKEFSAPAANLPCGQASDHAHLSNERLRIENLYKSRVIFRWVFEKLPQKAAVINDHYEYNDDDDESNEDGNEAQGENERI